MPDSISSIPQNTYDPRWFIWTIVFLVVTGISLVSYIMLSDNGTIDNSGISAARLAAKPHVSSTAISESK